MLRSKSLDRDSFNSGDHFNAIDWTMKDNGFGRGLPVKSKNGAAWDHMRPLLENPDLKPTPEQIDTSSEIAMDFLRAAFLLAPVHAGQRGPDPLEGELPELG